MYTLHYTEVKKIEMPGRVIYPMVGPDGIKSTQMSFGIALLPPKSRMEPHKHINEEDKMASYLLTSLLTADQSSHLIF